MATQHLFDNSTPTWGFADEGIVRSAGMAFVSPFTGQVTQIGWYRYDNVAGHAPSTGHLIDRASSQALTPALTITDPGTTGWHFITLSVPVQLAAGRETVVYFDWPVNSHRTQTASGTTVAPTYPLYTINNGGTYKNSAGAGVPDSLSQDGIWQGADVTWEQIGTDQPATPSDLANELADWLISTGDNTHQTDGLPWLTKVVVDTIHGVVGDTPGQLDLTKAVSDTIHDLLTQTDHNLGTLWDLAGHLADLEIAAWQAFFHSGEQRLTGPNSAGGSAFYTSGGVLVSDLVAQIHQMVRSYRNLVPVGGDGWFLAAEADFDDEIAFTASADAYVLTVTSWQDTQPANSSPAGTWLPRLGWWCVLTGDSASQRQFVDFANEILSDGGRRMPGCAIQLKPGTVAHVQAWQLA